MRLYDHLQTIDADFPDCVLLVGDEVADMIDELESTEDAHPPSFYGCVSPPFPCFFVEARKHFTKQQVLSDHADDAEFLALYRQSGLDALVTERGVLIEDITDDPRAKRGEHLVKGGALLPKGVKWILRVTGYTRQNGALRLYAGRCFVHLDENGHILDDLKRVFTTTYQDDELEPTIEYLPAMHLPKLLVFSLKTIGLLHERNEIEEVKPSRQVRRLAKRKGKAEPKPFYLLKVRERAKRRVTVGEITRNSEEQAAKRAHKVRGHFKIYGQGGRGLLFGKYEKTVWIPSHTRGDETQGALEKGYEVKPAKE